MGRVYPYRMRRDMRRQDRMEVELRVGPTSQAMPRCVSNHLKLEETGRILCGACVENTLMLWALDFLPPNL